MRFNDVPELINSAVGIVGVWSHDHRLFESWMERTIDDAVTRIVDTIPRR